MPDQPITLRSQRALDALTFFLADVQDGLGPFLAIYLTRVQHWEPGSVGVAMASIVVGTLLAQIPAGGLIDRVWWKRYAVVGAAGVVAICSVMMIAWPTLAVVAAMQALTGAAAAVMPPAIAGISLGLVGRSKLPRRASRNEAFNHAGNVAAAVLAGSVGTWLGYWAIFYLVAGMALASAVSALLIREQDIDHTVARGSDRDDAPHTMRLGSLLADRPLVMFLIAMFLFHFANAAMLPLVGQKVSEGYPETAAALMSACIIAAQVVMVPVAILCGRLTDSWGRKAVFLVAFGVLPIRGLAYVVSTNPAYLVAVQLLDGIGAGIYGVAGVVVIADLMRGTGRFNLAIGALATMAGLGAALSNLLVGFVVQAAGFDAGFVFLAAIAMAGLLFFAWTFRETRNGETSAPVEQSGVMCD